MMSNPCGPHPGEDETAGVAPERTPCGRSRPPAGDASIAIIGGGFAGICMAIKLIEAGRHDFVIYEKAADFGGTWRDNTYPGCSCDVPSHLYSLSFAQQSGWSRRFASQAEILAYLQDVARRHGIEKHVRFQTPITAMRWSDERRCWRLSTGDGRHFVARVVISAVGGLHLPAFPEIAGLDSFAGDCFHSARWRHDVDLSGKTVAVIGTGASAAQIVPEIAPKVGRLFVFQRTPQWVLPRHDRPYSRLERWAYRRVPGLLGLSRAIHYWRAEGRAMAFTVRPRFMGKPQTRTLRFLERTVPDPELRRKLWPTYTMGCKRVILSDTFYPAMNRPNVELVTEPIERISPTDVVTRDGGRRPVDTIICATGFHPFNPSDAIEIRGRGGRLLAEDWKDGPQAFRGVAVAGYPNYFLLMGPNSGLGHNSILFMIEAQTRYIAACLRWLDDDGCDAVEVREDAQRRFNDTLDRRFDRTVWRRVDFEWQQPCTTWYQHPSGRNTAIWPSFSAAYWLLMRRADWRHFQPAPAWEDEQPATVPLPGRRAA